MEVGVVFPAYEGAEDLGKLRAFAQGVESLGYAHIAVSEHVLDVKLTGDNHWNAPDELHPVYQDPFVFCSFMAGVAPKLGFSTCVMILPQRQTVLVAKQAATLDRLCNGRFRFGVGVGWNPVEFEALGVSFPDRGALVEDQVETLRALWTKPAVTVKTAYHTITNAGINPLPVQKPIPIWFGGANAGSQNNEKVLRRIARIGDGWLPNLAPDDEGKERLARFHGYCREYGREGQVGLEAFIAADRKTESNWSGLVKTWRGLGARYLSVNTTGDMLKGIDQHLRRLEEFRAALK
jgi:probable F420-dependent oxidoreductase